MIIAIPDMFPRKDRVHIVRDGAAETWRSDFTERKAEVPQVILVEQPQPDSQILPHYHAIDQFQVFLDGEGRLASHAIAPVSIHYTNAYTGYGPIVAGKTGMAYYVMRPGLDVMGPQHLHLPEARRNLKPGKKRFMLTENVRVKSSGELRTLSAIETEHVIEVPAGDPDQGIFAHLVSIGPDRDYTGQDPALGGGQVMMVLQGSMRFNGEALGLRATIAVTREEKAITIHSGADGTQILYMQYPLRTESAPQPH
jgi:hypothetical protein